MKLRITTPPGVHVRVSAEIPDAAPGDELELPAAEADELLERSYRGRPVAEKVRRSRAPAEAEAPDVSSEEEG